MADSEDRLLARELGKVGASAAKLAGKISGDSMPEAACDLAGAMGPGLVARFLPTERFQKELKVAGDAQTVLGKVYAFFAEGGRVATDEEAGTSPCPKVSGVIGSGFLNKNPAIVHVEITAVDAGACTLLITGAAKEGLIKQRTAEKAVNRVAAALGGSG